MKKGVFCVCLLLGCVSSLLQGGGGPADPFLQHRSSPPQGVHFFDFPGVTVVAVQDLANRMPGALFRSIDPADNVPLKQFYASSVNVFLLRSRTDGKICLVDAGFGRKESRLLPVLKTLGVTPEMVSGVAVTHIHPDHVGGLTTPDGGIAFPNAKVWIARKEYEAWRQDPRRRNLGRHLGPCREKLVLLDFDREIPGTGLTPRDFPGHTPGHTVFELNTGKTAKARPGSVCFAGDIVHAAELQIPHYRYCARFDADFRRAVDSREALLRAGGSWFGAHLPFPGKVRIVRRKNGGNSEAFSFVPEKE